MVEMQKGNSLYKASTCSDDCYFWCFFSNHTTTVKCKWVLTMFTLLISTILLADPNLTKINITNSAIDLAEQPNGRIHDRNSGNIVTFHLAFTTPNFTKLNQRCVESILYFHPKARVILHSNAKHGIHTAEPQLLEPIRRLTNLGYHIEIRPYDAADLLQRAMDVSDSIVDRALAKKWMSLISTQYSHEENWYSNETNLLRMSILYVTGGIYLDTDVVLVRPLVPTEPLNEIDAKSPAIMENTVTDNEALFVDNVMARDNEKFECAVMKFMQPGNIFLGHALNNFLQHYNGTVWGNNGPSVFGRVSEEMPHLLCAEPFDFVAPSSIGNTSFNDNDTNRDTCYMQPLPGTAFQPVPWWEWKDYCYENDKSPVGIEARNIIGKPNVYAAHMNNHIFGSELEKNAFVPNSVCDITLKNFCILCE